MCMTPFTNSLNCLNIIKNRRSDSLVSHDDIPLKQSGTDALRKWKKIFLVLEISKPKNHVRTEQEFHNYTLVLFHSKMASIAKRIDR